MDALKGFAKNPDPKQENWETSFETYPTRQRLAFVTGSSDSCKHLFYRPNVVVPQNARTGIVDLSQASYCGVLRYSLAVFGGVVALSWVEMFRG